ncbi:transmembrane protein 53-like [Liolophura sinensis]|uniref:transmembrane protein 53-like n=1 Tax=Liolophura sinensis TaxID=3198878 RepID=UPI0031584DE6
MCGLHAGYNLFIKLLSEHGLIKMSSPGNRVEEFGTLYRHDESDDIVFGVSECSKPLVVLFAWLGASETGVRQYVTVYIQRKVDVLVVRSDALDFLQPHRGKEVARKVLEYLLYTQKGYSRFVVHTFSIGAFIFTLCSLHVQDNTSRYGVFTQRLEGIVMDSCVVGSLENMATGISKISSTNFLLRNITFYIVILYLKLAWSTSQFYNHALEHIFNAPFDKPSLFFYCRNDPMCNTEEMEKLIDRWKSKLQSPVVAECWDKSVHAAHLKFHKDDYLKTLDEFCKTLPEFFTSSLHGNHTFSKL